MNVIITNDTQIKYIILRAVCALIPCYNSQKDKYHIINYNSDMNNS